MKKVYYNTKDELDEEYKAEGLDERLDKERIDEFLVTDTEKVVQVKHRTMPRMEDLKVEPLKRMTPEIVGSLFDRVRFLKERIEESNLMIQARNSIHEQVISEVNADIAEKKSMENQVK